MTACVARIAAASLPAGSCYRAVTHVLFTVPANTGRRHRIVRPSSAKGRYRRPLLCPRANLLPYRDILA